MKIHEKLSKFITEFPQALNNLNFSKILSQKVQRKSHQNFTEIASTISQLFKFLFRIESHLNCKRQEEEGKLFTPRKPMREKLLPR